MTIATPRRAHSGHRYAVALLASLVLGGCLFQPPEIEPTSKTDARMESSIKQALRDDKRVDAAAIRIEGDPRQIVLDGFTATESERQAVEEVARQQYPDASIDNRIEVQ